MRVSKKSAESMVTQLVIHHVHPFPSSSASNCRLPVVSYSCTDARCPTHKMKKKKRKRKRENPHAFFLL